MTAIDLIRDCDLTDPREIIDAVQTYWESDPDRPVLYGEVAALRYAAGRCGIALRERWEEEYSHANTGIPREVVEAWIYREAQGSAKLALPRISEAVFYGLWNHKTLVDALTCICDDLSKDDIGEMYFPEKAAAAKTAAKEIMDAWDGIPEGATREGGEESPQIPRGDEMPASGYREVL